MGEKSAAQTSFNRWHWTDQDNGQLAAKFKAALWDCLKDLLVPDASGLIPSEELGDQVQDLDNAATHLDECAANCHVAVKALRNIWGIDAGDATEAADVANRLSRSVGKPVILARTTIEELRGCVLNLAQVDGANAIIQHGNDYWGTPADRLVVLPTPAEEATLAAKKPNAEDSGKPSPRVAEFLERLEAGLQPPILIYSGNTPDMVRLDVCGERGGELVSLKTLPPELKKRLAEARRHTSELVLATTPRLENDFYFRLGKGELSNALQFLTMMNRTGVLDTDFHQGDEKGHGCVYVTGTRVFHVEYGNFDGVRALAEMLTLDEIEATFRDGVTATFQTIKSSTDQLLIEAAIQADELISQRRRGE